MSTRTQVIKPDSTVSKAKSVPPGPKGLPFLGVSLQFARDPLSFLQRVAREFGDIVRLSIEFSDRIFLNHPDWIKEVLIVHQSKFHKSERSRKLLGDLLGQGLLTSEGELWRRQRRLSQPAFRRSCIHSYAPTMLQIAENQARDWKAGEVRDICEEMMAITLEVAVQALFGTTLPGDTQKVGRATTFVTRYQLKRMQSPFKIPKSWPTPTNRRVKAAYEFLDTLIYRIISEREAQSSSCPHQDNVLSLLIAAMDEDGTRMTRKQLRDETITFFLAGHETTALALTWTWYLLSENPSVEARLHDELRGVLGGRTPDAEDMERLPYLQAVLKESLRLYPPAAVLSRVSTERCNMGGYDLPANTTVLLSQWVMHRDSRFYDQPERFWPERWLDGLEDKLPAGAYFPFGDGPRRCIGQGFAMLDAMLVIGLLAQRFQFRLVPNHPVEPEQLATLHPRYGLRMTIIPRT